MAALWKAFIERDRVVSVELASALSAHLVMSPNHLCSSLSLQLDYGIYGLGFILLMVLSIPYVPGSVFIT